MRRSVVLKKVVSLVVAASFLLAGCGDPKVLGEGSKRHFYETYGWFNESTYRSKDVCYSVSVGNVVWSILLVETIVMPIYFLGFSLYNPIRMKHGADDDCSIYSG